MLKISAAVADRVYSSEHIFEAMRTGTLNLSAYAERIHRTVEEKTMKSVKRATIVVALSRLQKEIAQQPSLKPQVHFDELTIQSPLFDVTYEKTQQNLDLIKNFHQHFGQSTYLALTQGVSELTLIAKEDRRAGILAYFPTKPKALFTDLVAVTVKFSENYLEQPNIIYAIISLLAVKKINLLEIVSTYTELTMVIHRNDLDRAIQALKN